MAEIPEMPYNPLETLLLLLQLFIRRLETMVTSIKLNIRLLDK